MRNGHEYAHICVIANAKFNSVWYVVSLFVHPGAIEYHFIFVKFHMVLHDLFYFSSLSPLASPTRTHSHKSLFHCIFMHRAHGICFEQISNEEKLRVCVFVCCLFFGYKFFYKMTSITTSKEDMKKKQNHPADQAEA